MYLLPVLEALDHVVDKLLRHLISQADAVVVIVDFDRIDVQVLERGGWLPHLDRFLELDPTDELLAFCKSQFGIAVVGLSPDNGFEVFEGLFGI